MLLFVARRLTSTGCDRRRLRVPISKAEFSSEASGGMPSASSPADPIPWREWKLRWGTTPILRASATLAHLAPRRLATATAQALSFDQVATRVINTWAASNSATRTEASPARLMAPVRSVWPDWYRRGVRPKHGPIALEEE